MNPRRTLATALRVLTQLRHDRQTLVMIFFVPCLLLVLVRYIYDAQPLLMHQIEPLFLGIFPLVSMFLITSITTLRERTSGTLDRLMTTPIAKLDFIAGYAIAFTVIATLQALLASWVVLHWLEIPVAGSALSMIIGAVASAFLGTTLGLFVSAFARTEFQAAQFMPLTLLPQFLLCGLLVPRDNMIALLRHISDFLPLSYCVDALKHIASDSTWNSTITHDLLIVLGVALGVLIIGAITIRRHD